MATLIQMPSPTEHVPVLAAELVALADPQPGEVAIDCTFGAGGHAREIANRLGPTGTLIAIDRDPLAGERFQEVAEDFPSQTSFVAAEFSDGLAQLAAQGVRPDLIYMDLGVSSMQLDVAERGFSYAYDAPLDMRMDPGQELSALEIVNTWPADRFAAILREFGEERHARSIAAGIVRRRPLSRTGELVDAIRESVPPAYRFGRGHPAKKTFQAIRIAVNGELDAVDRALPAAWEMLAPGGRLAVIAFHSLEDRRAKRFLAALATGCICPPELPVCACGHEPEAELLARRAVKPSEEEAERNPRSRSARLRVARKLAIEGSQGASDETPRR